MCITESDAIASAIHSTHLVVETHLVQLLQEVLSHLLALLLAIVLLQGIQDRDAHGRGHWVPPERVECDRPAHDLRNLRRGGHRSHGKPVPDPLGHGHDVRRHTVRLEAPKVITGATETSLDLAK